MSEVAMKILDTFSNPVYNTFTTKQAAARFRVDPTTVRRAVTSLRLDGYAIYRNAKKHEGRRINVYRLGKPSKRYMKALLANKTSVALEALNGN